MFLSPAERNVRLATERRGDVGVTGETRLFSPTFRNSRRKGRRAVWWNRRGLFRFAAESGMRRVRCAAAAACSRVDAHVSSRSRRREKNWRTCGASLPLRGPRGRVATQRYATVYERIIRLSILLHARVSSRLLKKRARAVYR